MELYTAFVVMGVSGVGKTSVSRALAARLSTTYIEADDYHPIENVEAMSAGRALTDTMRQPWLERIGDAVEVARKNGNVVVACSALKHTYRDLLRQKIGQIKFVYLHGDRQIIAARMNDRSDHFMTASLLESQIETLEPPSPDEQAISVNISATKEQVLKSVEQEVEAYLSKSTKTNY